MIVEEKEEGAVVVSENNGSQRGRILLKRQGSRVCFLDKEIMRES